MSILGEPYLLSSYTPPLRSISKKHAVHDVTCNEYDHKCFAAVSVQGDGVHVLELSTMRPVISHTLGPDTRFTCPSVIQAHEPGTSSMSIYAITERPGNSREGLKYDLLKWTDSLSSSSSRLPEQKSSPNFTENIHRIYSPQKMPSKLIALSASGHIYILSTETMTIDQVVERTTGNNVLLRSFNFSPESCSFASQFINAEGTLILRFILTNKTLFLKISLISLLGVKEVSVCHLCDDEEIIDVTCSPSGYITVLTAQGTWRIFRLDEQGHLIKEASSTLDLNLETTRPRYRGFTLISIASSFVLIACIEGSSDLHLALWDIRYSVVLATQKFNLPSNLTAGLKTSPQIRLVPATRTEVLVLVSPPTDSGTLSSSRSAIFVLPISMPASSSIALAMGKAPEAPVWLLNAKGPSPLQGGEKNKKLLDGMQKTISGGSPYEADNKFFAWVEEETERAKAKEKTVVDRPNNITRGAANKMTKRPIMIPRLSYGFVALLLDIILQPSKTAEVPYSPKIPLYLIQRKAVSDNMISGGLVSALRRRNDWESISAALQNMGDIPEEQIINLLIEVLGNHKRSSREDVMDVEPTSTSIPSLASFLPLVLQYQMSSTAACYALKTSLSNVDDILFILKELGQMLEQLCEQDLADSTVDPALPSLQSILSFMQLILDAHFLTLLQHPPARLLLQQISDHLQGNIVAIEDLNRLRGPLNSVLQTQGSASRNSGQKEDKKDRRKDTFNTIVGLYQVEELVL